MLAEDFASENVSFCRAVVDFEAETDPAKEKAWANYMYNEKMLFLYIYIYNREKERERFLPFLSFLSFPSFFCFCFFFSVKI